VPVMSCGWLPICWGEPNEPTLRENKGGGRGRDVEVALGRRFKGPGGGRSQYRLGRSGPLGSSGEENHSDGEKLFVASNACAYGMA